MPSGIDFIPFPLSFVPNPTDPLPLAPTGKVLPKLKRRSTHRKRRWPPMAQAERPKSMDAAQRTAAEGEEEEDEESLEEEPTDYVFRIVLEHGGQQGQQGGRFTGEEGRTHTSQGIYYFII